MKDQSASTIDSGTGVEDAYQSKHDEPAEGTEPHLSSPGLKRNILCKLEKPHEAKPMATLSHTHYEVKDNIIIGYDFSELKETSGAQLFRVSTRITF